MSADVKLAEAYGAVLVSVGNVMIEHGVLATDAWDDYLERHSQFLDSCCVDEHLIRQLTRMSWTAIIKQAF